MTLVSRLLVYSLALGALLRAGLAALAAWEPSLAALGGQAANQMLAAGLSRQWSFGPWFGVGHMPLYPTFLAVCHWLTGLSAPGAELPARAVGAALAVQGALGMAGVYLLYRAGALYSRPVGFVAAALGALNLGAALYGARLQAEALVFPLMCLALYLLLLYRRTGGGVRLGALAAVLGLAALASPALVYAPLGVVPFLLLEWGRGGFGARLGRVVLFVALFGLFVLPWLGRNLYYFGHAGLYGLDEAHVLERVAPAVLGAARGVDPADMGREVRAMWQARLGEPVDRVVDPLVVEPGDAPADAAAEGAEAQEDAGREAMARTFLAETLAGAGPAAVAEAWGLGAARAVFAPAAGDVASLYGLRHRAFAAVGGDTMFERAWKYLAHNRTVWLPALAAVGALATALLRLAALVGLGVLARRRPGDALALGLMIVGVLVVVGPAGDAAARMPLKPVFALLAARGLSLAGVLRDDEAEAGERV